MPGCCRRHSTSFPRMGPPLLCILSLHSTSYLSFSCHTLSLSTSLSLTPSLSVLCRSPSLLTLLASFLFLSRWLAGFTNMYVSGEGPANGKKDPPLTLFNQLSPLQHARARKEWERNVSKPTYKPRCRLENMLPQTSNTGIRVAV